MSNLENVEKIINSELTSKVQKSLIENHELLIEINERKFSKDSLRACKEINRSTINYYFEELNIKSRIFFK